MTRALIVDDHPAVRNGLVSALRSEPQLVPLATAGGLSDALAEAERRKPDVALVDYQLSDGDGLLLCHRLKQLTTPPAVVIYSAFVRPQLALGAAVAGADGLVDKEARSKSCSTRSAPSPVGARRCRRCARGQSSGSLYGWSRRTCRSSACGSTTFPFRDRSGAPARRA